MRSLSFTVALVVVAILPASLNPSFRRIRLIRRHVLYHSLYVLFYHILLSLFLSPIVIWLSIHQSVVYIALFLFSLRAGPGESLPVWSDQHVHRAAGSNLGQVFCIFVCRETRPFAPLVCLLLAALSGIVSVLNGLYQLVILSFSTLFLQFYPADQFEKDW